MAVLSAADERSGQVYGGVGFRASGHLLVYGDGKAVDSKDDRREPSSLIGKEESVLRNPWSGRLP